MEETDHILQCPYCDVKSFLFSSEPFRFVLPHNTKNKEILHVPYLRFRGVCYACQASNVKYRILDITRLALPLKRFPVSLGLRPQAMKMRFLSYATEGSFLKCFLNTSQMLKKAEKQFLAAIREDIFHKAYVGEAVNLIYLPLYFEKGALFDAITRQPVARLPRDREKIFIHNGKRPALTTHFPCNPLSPVRLEHGRGERQCCPHLPELSNGMGSRKRKIRSGGVFFRFK